MKNQSSYLTTASFLVLLSACSGSNNDSLNNSSVADESSNLNTSTPIDSSSGALDTSTPNDNSEIAPPSTEDTLSPTVGQDTNIVQPINIGSGAGAYLKSGSLWPFPERIPVCWENPEENNSEERQWVESIISETWSKYSAVNFIGWNACATASQGIRVLIGDDVWPSVQYLGSKLSGVKNGMKLNFESTKFAGCFNSKKECIENVAIHEFGHALGFSHEQNRPDAPAGWAWKCNHQGTNGDLLIGQADHESVMNYCKPDSSYQSGRLSRGDIYAVQVAYGTRPAERLPEFGYNQGWRVSEHPRFVEDMNSDGFRDIVGFAKDGVYVALSNGSGFTSSTKWSDEFGAKTSSWRVSEHPRFVEDMNGDGYRDIIGFAKDGVYVALSNGSGFARSTKWSDEFGAKTDGWKVSEHPRFVEDMNGDGYRDIIGFAKDGVYVALSNGSSFSQSNKWSEEYGSKTKGWQVSKHPRFVKDINGDGMADVVGFAQKRIIYSTSSSLYLNGPFLGGNGMTIGNGGWEVSKHPRIVKDVNNDGYPDLIGFSKNSVVVAVNNNSYVHGDELRFKSPIPVAVGFGSDAGWDMSKYPRIISDITGDGMPEIIGFAKNGVIAKDIVLP